MATFTAVKNRGGGRGALGGVTRYVSQKEKTLWERQRLVTGWNCTAQSVRDVAHQRTVSKNGRAAVLPLRPVLCRDG